MYGIKFYVPTDHLETVKRAMFDAGAGRVRNYESCAFQVLGQGQYRPLEGSQPYAGQRSQLSRIEEYVVEMVCDDDCIIPVLQALKQSHPYETPAYGCWKLQQLEDFRI